MLTKIFVGVVMAVILISLGSGLYYLIHDQSNSNRIVKALTWRIGISFVLFLLLFLAFALGLISPHGV